MVFIPHYTVSCRHFALFMQENAVFMDENVAFSGMSKQIHAKYGI